jgi:hypothetical protein
LSEIINFQSEIFNLEHINPLVSRYKLYIAYADEPANNYIFSKDVLDNLSLTIKGCAVVAGFMNEKDGSLLGGHESDLSIDEQHRIVPTPSPIPVGFAAYDINPWWEVYKGKNYLTTFIYIWDGRFPELSNLNERKIFQSMEVAVDNDKDGKYKIVKQALALGLCLLENVDPAFVGSHIEKFSIDDDSLINLKQEYELFAHRYTSLDFTIPKVIKKNVQEALELKIGTSVGQAIARHFIKNEKSTPEKVRQISKYFNRHSEESKDWNLYGSHAGRKWSVELTEQMNELDEKRLSYMSQENNNLSENIVLDKEVEKVNSNEKFSLNSSQILEILNNAFSEFKYGEQWRKYWANSFDEEYVYVYDSEDSKVFRFTYSVEENKATINFESKEEVIQGSYIPVGKTANAFSDKLKEFCDGQKFTKEEKEICKYSFAIHDDKYMYALDQEVCKMVAVPFSIDEEGNLSVDVDKVKMAKLSIFASENEGEDEVYMAISQMFSSNQNVDVVAMQKLNDDAATENKRLAEENNDISQKFSSLEAEHNTLKEETKTLRGFKADIEDQNKKFAVESTLKDVVDVLSEEIIKECRESAEKFSLEDIDIWKNEVKAKAFNFSKQIPEKKGYLWMALPNADNPKKGKGLWD